MTEENNSQKIVLPEGRNSHQPIMTMAEWEMLSPVSRHAINVTYNGLQDEITDLKAEVDHLQEEQEHELGAAFLKGLANMNASAYTTVQAENGRLHIVNDALKAEVKSLQADIMQAVIAANEGRACIERLYTLLDKCFMVVESGELADEIRKELGPGKP